GWGVQFQDPLFLILLAVLLVLFACNLWGFFEVPLPRGVAAIAERGPLGSIATGAFATLLATPCSAPFVGTALGFAFAAGPMEIIAIFLALGIGMAAPYLLVAVMPGLAIALLLAFAGLTLAVLHEPVSRWMLVAAALIGALFVPTLAPPLPRVAVAAREGPWRAFDAGAIGGLVRDG